MPFVSLKEELGLIPFTPLEELAEDALALCSVAAEVSLGRALLDSGGILLSEREYNLCA